MTFLYFKALHLVFMVSWFAGLFYIIRLFIYHVESLDLKKELSIAFQKQYQLMERRLWYIITWPAALLTLVFGVGMLIVNPHFLSLPWMHVKLGLVALLYVYHFWCHRIFLQMQRSEFPYSSGRLRMINEVATLLLFAIVFVVVLKSALGWITATLGVAALAALLMLGIRWYKRYRAKSERKD